MTIETLQEELERRKAERMPEFITDGATRNNVSSSLERVLADIYFAGFTPEVKPDGIYTQEQARAAMRENQ